MNDTATPDRTVSFNLPGAAARDIAGGPWPEPEFSRKGRGHTAKFRDLNLVDARKVRDALHDAGHRDEGDKVRDVIDGNSNGDDPAMRNPRPIRDTPDDESKAKLDGDPTPLTGPSGIDLHRDDVAAARKHADRQANASNFVDPTDESYCCTITTPGFVAVATDGRVQSGRFVANADVSYVAELHRRWVKRNR